MSPGPIEYALPSRSRFATIQVPINCDCAFSRFHFHHDDERFDIIHHNINSDVRILAFSSEATAASKRNEIPYNGNPDGYEIYTSSLEELSTLRVVAVVRSAVIIGEWPRTTTFEEVFFFFVPAGPLGIGITFVLVFFLWSISSTVAGKTSFEHVRFRMFRRFFGECAFLVRSIESYPMGIDFGTRISSSRSFERDPIHSWSTLPQLSCPCGSWFVAVFFETSHHQQERSRHVVNSG